MVAITPDQLNGFLIFLRTRGWRVGVDDHISAQRLLHDMRAASGVTVDDVRDSIGAVVCSSPEEQRLYCALFNNFFASRMATVITIQEDEQPTIDRKFERIVVGRSRLLWGAA